MTRLCLRILAAALALAGLPVRAQQPELDPNQRVIAAIRQSLQQHPDDPTLHYYLAAFQARARDRDGALASLQKVLELGEGLLPPKALGFEHLQGDAAYQAIYRSLEARLPKVADAPIAFRLSDARLIPEGIAYDPGTRHFYVGSIAQKRIVRVRLDGRTEPFSRDGDGLQHVLGLAIDPRRRLLYAVSTSALTDAGRKQPLNAVVRYDLKSGRHNGEFRIAAAQQLNDVAVAPDGDVYVSDSASGAIWRAFDQRDAPTAFSAPGALRGTNGIAVSADGRFVYAAHSTGVARLATADGKLERLTPAPRETVASIDGLYVWKGDLIGIQNVSNPGRVIRLRLAPDGVTITRVDTLQSHHNPAFDEPTTGAIAGDAIYVLGTTQVARFNDKGELEDEATLKPPAVVRVPLPSS